MANPTQIYAEIAGIFIWGFIFEDFIQFISQLLQRFMRKLPEYSYGDLIMRILFSLYRNYYRDLCGHCRNIHMGIYFEDFIQFISQLLQRFMRKYYLEVF
jgi:hypothetical protein